MNAREIIKTKQDITWHFIRDYLYMLRYIPPAMEDISFCHIFADLENYIESKLNLLDDGDVIDIYAVVEQQSIKTKSICKLVENS